MLLNLGATPNPKLDRLVFRLVVSTMALWVEPWAFGTSSKHYIPSYHFVLLGWAVNLLSAGRARLLKAPGWL